MKKNLQDTQSSLLDFIKTSPTPWHVVANAAKLLDANGFFELKDKSVSFKKDKKFFMTREGASIAAFVLPKKEIKSLKIALAHTDSPGLKLKPHPEIQAGGQLLLASEVYGSPLLTSWLNRDLCVAGRVFAEDKKGGLSSHLIHLEEFIAIIPQLAIHLDRESKEKGLTVNAQNHLYAIASLLEPGKESSLLKLIENKIKSSILSFDLFLVPKDEPRLAGLNQELISTPRFDNLGSVHAILEAFNQSKEESLDCLKCFFFWNHEEVGSLSAEGAESSFFQDSLERIGEECGLKRSELLRIFRTSLALSVDQAHASHPSFPERHEPHHPVRLGGGVVLKHNSQKKYASNAENVAIAKSILLKEKIPFQEFVMRNDMPCGSTVGSIFAGKTGISTLDIGCPMLSMHSIRELASTVDQGYMVDFLKVFFNKSFINKNY